MAKCSPENEHLLHDGESETSFSSPEKSRNKTDLTLLDLSLSLNVDNGKSDISTQKDDRENLIQKEHEQKISSKDGTGILEEALPDVGSNRKEETKDQKATNPQRPDLKKSKSYGITSTVEYAPPKQKFKHSLSAVPNSSKNSKALNIAVFVKEGKGNLLSLDNGRQTLAGEIKQMMMDVLSIPYQFNDVFAVWLISPLLELQLKNDHIPFRLRRQWKDLLRKFAWAEDDEIEKDEPVMVFQRSSFYSVADEKKITNEKVIRRLFEEAKLNVLKGRYRIANADAEMLGGILACIEHGRFDRDKHIIGFFRKSLDNFLPQSAIRRQWLSKKFNRNTLEQHLIENFQLASERTDEPKKFFRMFLEFCWTLPFYGAAFFKGQVEQVSHDRRLWKPRTMNVSIGIGREGITIFRESNTEILINLSYNELSWDYSPSSEDSNVGSFCIEYDSVSNDGRHVANQLQIFSPQSAMMDALVDSCVSEMNRLKIPKSPVSPVFVDDKPLADPGPPQMKKEPKRTTFSLSNPFKIK